MRMSHEYEHGYEFQISLFLATLGAAVLLSPYSLFLDHFGAGWVTITSLLVPELGLSYPEHLGYPISEIE